MTDVMETGAQERIGDGTGRHATLPDDSSAPPDFEAIQNSAEFADLRRTIRRFVIPATAAFFAWYVGYVLLADYAHSFMSHRLFGHINVGLVLGVLQFFTTAIITVCYGRYATQQIDPRADAIRRSL